MIKLRQAVLLLCVEHAALHDVILSSLVMLSVEEEVQRTAALLDTVIDKTPPANPRHDPSIHDRYIKLECLLCISIRCALLQCVVVDVAKTVHHGSQRLLQCAVLSKRAPRLAQQPRCRGIDCSGLHLLIRVQRDIPLAPLACCRCAGRAEDDHPPPHTALP